MGNPGGLLHSAPRWAIAAVAVLAALSCQPQAGDRMTQDQALAIGSRWLEARNTYDLDLLDDIYAPGVVVHDCSLPEAIQGLGALKSFYEASHSGFPDLRMSIDDVFVSGDHVIFRGALEATHLGSLRGIPPTGKRVVLPWVAIDRIEDGKIAEESVYYDELVLLKQLGLFPPSPTASPQGG